MCLVTQKGLTLEYYVNTILLDCYSGVDKKRVEIVIVYKRGY